MEVPMRSDPYVKARRRSVRLVSFTAVMFIVGILKDLSLSLKSVTVPQLMTVIVNHLFCHFLRSHNCSRLMRVHRAP